MPGTKRASKSKAEILPWDGMPIFLAPLGSLVHYAQNSKDHPEEQIVKLMGSLKGFGWVRPILVNSRKDLGIRAGHGTVTAATRLWEAGHTIVSAFNGKPLPDRMVPCVAAEHLSETQLRAYVIADNKLADAPWNQPMLDLEMRELKDEGFDLALTGFDLPEIEAMLEEHGGPGQFPEANENIDTEHQCPKCGYKWSGNSSPAQPPETKKG